VQGVLAGQYRKQVRELPPRGLEETAVARNPHQHLRDRKRDDLGVGQLPARVRGRIGQQIVRRAIDSDAEPVEVGVHRGLQVDGAIDTADFDLPLGPYPPRQRRGINQLGSPTPRAFVNFGR
jgi:hypothetical protein